jgi:hypothetical protein
MKAVILVKYVIIIAALLTYSAVTLALPNCKQGKHPTDPKWQKCYGSLTFENGDSYTGELLNGARHGKGTFTLLDDGKYVGEWINNLMHGTGVVTVYEDGPQTRGFEYSGEFKNGSIDGVGTLKYVNGEVYVGDFKEDKRNGIGVNVSENGEIQAGIFEDEVLTHSGENRPRCPSEGIWDNCIGVYYNSGDKYSGYWKTDRRHGLGIYTWQNGMQYVGNWKAGKRSGEGTQTFVNGDIYEGGWKAGKRDGKGTQTLVNGDVYEGDWKDSKQHGRGTQNLSNGDKYVGDFKAGKRNGTGLLTSKNKDTYKGRFENDEYQDPKVLAVRLKLASTQMAKRANQLRDIKLGKGFVNKRGDYITIVNPNEYNSTDTISWEKAHPAIKFIATIPGIEVGGAYAYGAYSAQKISKCSYKAITEYDVSFHKEFGKLAKIFIDYNKINWTTKDYQFLDNRKTITYECKGNCVSIYGKQYGPQRIAWSSASRITFSIANRDNLYTRANYALRDIEEMCSASSSDY